MDEILRNHALVDRMWTTTRGYLAFFRRGCPQRTLQIVLGCAFIAHHSFPARAQNLFHVDSAATGPIHDGMSWCTAFRDLQDALGLARGTDEIRIAVGRYRPDRGTMDPREEFRLRDGIILRGGYAGCQSVTPDTRDPRLYEVILTGDLNGDDGTAFSGTGENSFHVIRTSGTGVTATLDGLTVSGGNAKGDTTAQTRGGGLQATSDSRISVFDCRFVGNQASDDGGAVHVEGGAPVFSHCSFIGNRAGDDGGAMRIGATTAVISNCAFRENRAQGRGGGIYGRDSSLTVTASRFEKNIARVDGGAISLVSQRLTLQNSFFSENSADGLGGAVWLETGVFDSTDCILTANRALRGGGVATSRADNLMTRALLVQNEASAGGALFVELSRGVLNDCTFNQNSAVDTGGALSIVQSDMLWNRLSASENTALRDGGALALENSSIQMVRAHFKGNLANDDGGALTALTSSVAVVNSQFLANAARDNGGAARLEGSEVQFVNAAFVGNESGARGGAIEGTGGSLGMTNCTLAGNVAKDIGGVAWDVGDVVIQNSILWRNQDAAGGGVDAEVGDIPSSAIRRSCVSGWGARGGEFVIDTDPRFVSQPGPDQKPGTADDNLRLAPGSPCLNAGDNALLPADMLDLDQDGDLIEALPVDIDDRNRVLGAAVDLGAWEFYCIDDRGCDDGSYCSGIEFCSNGGCVSGNPPCGDRLCSEDLRQCVQCLVDQDCTDDRFCTGAERCVSHRCETQAVPCMNLYCDEARDSCADCLANEDCDDYDQCTIDRCDNGSCQFAEDVGCADADADGVADASDHCPGTSPGAEVDEIGCSCLQLDEDGDGIKNCDDECPDTVISGEPKPNINSIGCVVSARPSPVQCGAIGPLSIFLMPGMIMTSLVCAKKMKRLTQAISPNPKWKPWACSSITSNREHSNVAGPWSAG